MPIEPVKTINSLMKYLRSKHNISIEGSKHKRHLRNFGYYHGFKGYRFIKSRSNPIAFSDFNQITAINIFDMNLKSLFYPHIMFIETALKNYLIEVVLNEAKSSCFNDIYDKVLTNYKTYRTGSNNHYRALTSRLLLRNKVYGSLSRGYKNKLVVRHFYHKDEFVPIWAIFEILSLGEFGYFVSCLNVGAKKKFGSDLKLNSAFNANGKLAESAIFLIQPLRNAIAHNDVVFDARFRNSNPSNSLVKSIENDTQIPNITFDTIVDYLILVIYFLKNLCVSKTDLRQITSTFEKIINQFRSQINPNIYSRIFYTDTRNKLNKLQQFISI